MAELQDRNQQKRIKKIQQNFALQVRTILLQLLLLLILYSCKYINIYGNYTLGTSKTQRNYQSPERESTDEENTEFFSTPDRSAINLKKNSGKSTLKGRLCDKYY